MSFLQEVVVEIRRFRHEHGISPRERVDAVISASDELVATALGHADELRALASIGALRTGEQPDGWSRVVAAGAEVYLPLSESVDRDAERHRLEKGLAEAEQLATRAQAKLSNEGFTSGAPADVVAKVRAQLDEHTERAARLRAQLQELGS
jgi:valyl-tRNA synthetase